MHIAKAHRAHLGEVVLTIARMGTLQCQNKAFGGTAEHKEILLDRRRPDQATLTCLR